jgi:hypothetical protein
VRLPCEGGRWPLEAKWNPAWQGDGDIRTA